MENGGRSSSNMGFCKGVTAQGQTNMKGNILCVFEERVNSKKSDGNRRFEASKHVASIQSARNVRNYIVT